MTFAVCRASLLRAVAMGACGATLALPGCNTDQLLKAEDPDIIIEANSASGAIAQKNGVILRLTQATNGIQGPDALFVFSGLLADEYRSGDTFIQRNLMDQRIWDPTNTFLASPFRFLSRVRVEGQGAIAALRTYAPTPNTNIGLLFAVIGYSENLAGELFCNGIPLSYLGGGSQIVYGDPLSVDSVFALAIGSADSALIVTTTQSPFAAADSLARKADSLARLRTRVLAAVVKGRALLNRGQFAAAAAAVAGVGDTLHFDISHSLVTTDNQAWSLNTNNRRYTVADTEGVNGLDFFSANDPRVPRALGTKNPDDLTFDTFVFVIRQGIWGRTSPVKIATGIEARLIEAEAALRAGDAALWLSKLNALRANTTLLPTPQSGYSAGPALAPLTDPGTADARVDLMFRERAFWMFSTGHRLGDLRRLVRPVAAGGYGRAADAVYPKGPWYKGGNYGDATMLSLPSDEQNNPKFVQCTDRNP